MFSERKGNSTFCLVNFIEEEKIRIDATLWSSRLVHDFIAQYKTCSRGTGCYFSAFFGDESYNIGIRDLIVFCRYLLLGLKCQFDLNQSNLGSNLIPNISYLKVSRI